MDFSRPDGKERPDQVYPQKRLPVVRALFEEASHAAADSGVGADDIQPAMSFHCGGHNRGDLPLVACVSPEVHDGTGTGRFCLGGCIDVDGDHIGALISEKMYRRLSNSRCRTRYKDALASEARAHRMPFIVLPPSMMIF